MTASIFTNRDQLLSHGNVEGRRIVLDILEAGLRAGDPYPEMMAMVRLEGNRLVIGSDRHRPCNLPPLHSAHRPDAQVLPGPLEFDLDAVNNVYVVGGGKAAQRMAEALEHVLGNRITAGQVNAKKGDQVRLDRIHVTLAGHPLPDEDSVRGSQRMLELEQSAREGDLVLLVESGGASALCALPAPGVSLDDLRQVYRVLYLQRGATLPEVNAVRNLCSVLIGRHARYVGEATLVTFVTDETPPGLRVHLRKTSDYADSYQNAVDVLQRYDCWDLMPQSVRDFITRADPQYVFLRPEEWYGRRRCMFRVMGPELMLAAAERRAREMGLNSAIIASSLSDVEAHSVGETMAYIAQEMEVYARPFTPPSVLLCGGELLVRVGDADGSGGRNQEFVLSTARRIEGSTRIVIGSADSDGSDGCTEYNGGIVDGETARRAREAGFDVAAELRRHNSSAVLQTLGDASDTGILGTNVRDLRVVYVGPAESGTD